MIFFRRIYRLLALFLWTLIVVLISMPYQIRGGWRGIKKICDVSHLWSRGIARIINLRVKVMGDLPRVSGGFVVSNHLSYVDIITHGSVFPLRYSPKTDIAKWPFIGWVVGLARPVWIDRKSRQSAKRIVRDFARTIEHGISVIIYPEGTSTDGKSGLLPFRSGPFQTAVDGDLPVVPILTRYREAPGDPPVCWYGDMTLMPHMWKLLGVPRIEAELRILPPVAPEGRSRKEMASFMHGLMTREYNFPQKFD